MSSSRKVTAIPGLAAILAAVVLVALALPGPARARPLVTGVTNLYVTDQLAFDRVKQSGSQFVRTSLNWGATAPGTRPAGWQPENPSSPGYNWTESDEAVTHAVQAGLTPVLVIDGAPRWAQRCDTPPVLPSAICDPDPDQLAAFATAAARRYSGEFQGLPRVRYWHALNEPNLSLFFFPQFNTEGRALSANLYRALVNAFYGSVKAVNPSNLVLAAGLGPIAVPKYTIGPMQFTRELLCMKGRRHPRPAAGSCGGGVHFDIFAVHSYTTGAPTHHGKADDVQLGDLGKLRALLKAADRAGRIKGKFKHTPLWITEFSWDTNPPDPGGLKMKIAKRWTAEAIYVAWRSGVSRFFWYSLRDGAREPGVPFSETLESGLYFRGATVAEDRPKPLLAAFRFPFVAYPRKNGLVFWGRTPTSGPGKVAIEILEQGRWHTLSTRNADKAGIFSGTLGSTYGRDKSGAVRARFQRQKSVPFSMRPVKGFYQPPFG